MAEKVYGPGHHACKKCGRLGYFCRCGAGKTKNIYKDIVDEVNKDLADCIKKRREAKKLAGGVKKGDSEDIKWERDGDTYTITHTIYDFDKLTKVVYMVAIDSDAARRLAKFILGEDGG